MRFSPGRQKKSKKGQMISWMPANRFSKLRGSCLNRISELLQRRARRESLEFTKARIFRMQSRFQNSTLSHINFAFAAAWITKWRSIFLSCVSAAKRQRLIERCKRHWKQKNEKLSANKKEHIFSLLNFLFLLSLDFFILIILRLICSTQQHWWLRNCLSSSEAVCMIRSLTLFQGLHLLAHAKLNLKFNTTFSRTFQRQSKEVANAWHETTVQFCTCNTLCVESFQCPQEKTPQRGYFSALSFLFRDERKKSLQCALYGARTMREDSVPPNRGFSPLWGREKCQRGFVNRIFHSFFSTNISRENI